MDTELLEQREHEQAYFERILRKHEYRMELTR
jgi:hypothetical protein